MYATSGEKVADAAVLDCIIGSFDAYSVIVYLVQAGLLQVWPLLCP
jgi:hypothetical protein